GARVRQRLTREQLERGVVVHRAVAQHAAVTVIGVLAHAHVRDRDELGKLALEGAHGFLHRAALVPRRGADRVLGIGNAEEQHAADLRSGRAFGIAEHFVYRSLRHAGHGLHGLADTVAGADEERQDELAGLEPRFAHEAAQRLGAAEAAGAGGGRGGKEGTASGCMDVRVEAGAVAEDEVVTGVAWETVAEDMSRSILMITASALESYPTDIALLQASAGDR